MIYGGELPLLLFGYPIGFVPASRGGVFIESKYKFRHYQSDFTEYSSTTFINPKTYDGMCRT